MVQEDQGGVSYTPAQELSFIVTNIISSNPGIEQSTINDLYGVVRDGGDAIRDGHSTFSDALGGIVAIAEQAPDVEYIPSLPEQPTWDPNLYGVTSSGVQVQEPSFADAGSAAESGLQAASDLVSSQMAILQSRPNMNAEDAFAFARAGQAVAAEVQAGRVSRSLAEAYLIVLSKQARDIILTVPGPVPAGVTAATDIARLGIVITPPHTGSGGLLLFNVDPNLVGPDGRTFAQVTGTEYKSDAERAWWLAIFATNNDPIGPGGRTFAQTTGKAYINDAERTWYLGKVGVSVDSANNLNKQTDRPVNLIQGVPLPVGGAYVYPDGDLRKYAVAAAQAHGQVPQYFINLMDHEGGFNPSKRDPDSGAWAGILPSTAASMKDSTHPNGYTINELVADPPKAYELSNRYLETNSKMSFIAGDQAKLYASYYVGAGTIQEAVNTGGANWLSVADSIAYNRYGQHYSQTPVSTFLRSIAVI